MREIFVKTKAKKNCGNKKNENDVCVPIKSNLVLRDSESSSRKNSKEFEKLNKHEIIFENVYQNEEKLNFFVDSNFSTENENSGCVEKISPKHLDENLEIKLKNTNENRENIYEIESKLANSKNEKIYNHNLENNFDEKWEILYSEKNCVDVKSVSNNFTIMNDYFN